MGLCIAKLQKNEAKKENTPIFPPHLKTSHVIEHFVDKLPSRLQGEGIHLLRAGPGPIVQRWTHELLEDAGVHNYEDRALLLKVRDEMTAAVAEHRKRRREYLLQLQQQEEQQLRRCSGAPTGGGSTGGGMEGSSNPSPAAWRSIRRWSLGSLTSDTGAGEATSGGGAASQFATVSVSSSAVSCDTDATDEDNIRATVEAAEAAAAAAAASNTAAWLDKSDGKPFHLQSDWLPAGVSLYRISEEMRHAVSSGLDVTGSEGQFVSAASSTEAAAAVAAAEDVGLNEGKGTSAAGGLHEANGSDHSDVCGAAAVAAVATDAVTCAPQPCSRGPWPPEHTTPRPVHEQAESRLGRRPSVPSGPPMQHPEGGHEAHGSAARVLVNEVAAGHGSGSALASAPERPYNNEAMDVEEGIRAASPEVAVQAWRRSETGAAEAPIVAAAGAADIVIDGRGSPATPPLPMRMSSSRNTDEQRLSGNENEPGAAATPGSTAAASPLISAAVGPTRLDSPWAATDPTTTNASVAPGTSTANSALLRDTANYGGRDGRSTSLSTSPTSSPDTTTTSQSVASCSVAAATTTAGVPSSRGLSTFNSSTTSISDDAGGGSGSPGSYHGAAAGDSNSSQETMGNRETLG